MFLTLMILCTSAYAQVVNIEGLWKITHTDKPEYAACNYDDSNWQVAAVPGGWDLGSENYDGTGWLRLKFDVPVSVEPQDMILELGKIDDEDHTYLNGERVGASKGWNRSRAYAIPKRLIKFGGTNCLAIRVYDEGGGGGIYEGPLMLRAVKEGERVVFATVADRTPIFPISERNAMPRNHPFQLSWVMKDGIRVPRIDGRGLWGASGLFSNQPPCQAYYEAPIVAQQGLNNFRLGFRPVDEYNLDVWTKLLGAFEQQGISSMWLAYSMENEFIERLVGVEGGSLGQSDYITRENGERKAGFGGAGTLGNMWNPAFIRNSEKMFERATQSLAFKTVIGFQVTNETYLENGSYDPYARKSWQQFLKALFNDDSPAADTNGDGTFYNKAYGKAFKSWKDVEMFRSDDLQDPGRVLLKDIWLGVSYANYLQRMASVIHKYRPDAMVSPSICVPVSAPVDLSYVASMPDINVSCINTYGCWLGSGLLMAAIANTYGRPAIASEINYPVGGYSEMRWTALTMLPYYEGYEWFGYNQKDGSEPEPDEMQSEYGGKYGLIDHGMTCEYDGDGDPSCAGEVSVATEYDPRFAVLPELAPFVGKLHSDIDKSILWITASGYRPDYEEDHRESELFRANVTSDMAVALKPEALSLQGKKVVIYRNIESPCISRNIYRKLADYVKSGGTVVTGAYYIGKGTTLIGEDNSIDWWNGLKLARNDFTADGDTTIHLDGQSYKVAGTHQYLLPGSGSVKADGEITDSTGAKYPLVFVRNEGKGKWVLINYPMIFRMSEREGGWMQDKYDTRFRILRQIVKKHASVNLPYRFEMQTYAGDGCLLAIKEGEPSGVDLIPEAKPRFKANVPTTLFEIYEKKLYGGAFVKPVKGEIEVPETVKSGEAKLWVAKPYGKPVVLYVDGTVKSQGRTDDGAYKDGKLTFTFAERAYISSPKRPKTVEAAGQKMDFDYDESNHLLLVKRTGLPVQATVIY